MANNITIGGWVASGGEPFVQDQKTTTGINWNDFYSGIVPAAPPKTPPKITPLSYTRVPDPPVNWDDFYKSVGRPDWWNEPAAPVKPVAQPASVPLPKPRPWWAPQGPIGVVKAPMPVDSDIPLNAPQAPAPAPAKRGVAAIVQAAVRTIKGSSTGKSYAVGSKGATGAGFIYEASPNGFVKVGDTGGSSASRYEAANAGPGSVAAWDRIASGNQSSGGGPAAGGEYGGGR
jgi:hypothetical protein